MAYDSVRAQLDKLLGADRNGPLTAASQPSVSYTDSSVCKHFLLGFCPHDLHIKHRSEPGSCPKDHSSVAKAKFERDRQQGKLTFEIARWTRDLLHECKAILEDEERKIRGHARRLQDTYKTSGDLSGLMIRNFDTLKKLGMVSQNAKVRILSEMDELNPFLGHDDVDQASETASHEAKEPDSTNRLGTEVKRSPKSDDKGENGDTTSDQDDLEVDDEDEDDDLDGFGVIKVIPAQSEKNGTSLSDAGVGPDNQSSKADPREDVEEATGEKNDVKERIAARNKNDPKSDSEAGSSSEQVASTGGSSDQEKSVQQNKDTASLEKDVNSTKEAEKDVGDKPAAKISLNGPQTKMDEFYKTGKGPDGLLMLDRKQSLRVCACCGGFISLVDAESRLLSHYGGKSHHSLAQLREKVAELERQVAADRRPGDRYSRDFVRRRHDERELTYSRRDDYRRDTRRRDDYARDDFGRNDRYSRNYDRYDRYGDYDRDSGRRGHGTSDWYDRPMRGRDDFGRDDRYRRYDSDQYRRDRRGDRYESGRKRRRPGSPNYNRPQRPRY
eukprot:GFKZ01014199.1.p1 GENE.GFKZ01014199.1~~GFKZ01014199.1.p1  ORF type:complete len:555 (+),score=82.27 GFKZ01014199.1:395-2059(+)